ncbi:MAG: hypothetical protein PHY34_06195 [Patescibacteria group bacterium]|nr:hypothetical protein [Patescibacteria group bacterium]MDD5715787.1 hypothetical protein [Patescibacteria group bacterium]
MEQPVITKHDRKQYVLKTRQDEEILVTCKRLETMRLSKQDKRLVRFFKSQLLDDWRTPLKQEVKKLFKKY